MLVFLNGKLVSEEKAVVSVFDRSFLYGDGLFETMLVCRGKAFLWAQHMARLERGAKFLKIAVPFSGAALRSFADELIVKNQLSDALLRLTLSRGVGLRGYSPKGAENPIFVMSLHPFPSVPTGQGSGKSFPKWKLVTSSFRLPAGEPLAQFKTCNKLPQVLARAEADAAGADEAVLANTDDFIVEASTSNLFWVDRETVCTPPLASGILAGVTRVVVLDLCSSLRIATREARIKSEELKRCDGVFLSLSSWGVVPVESLDGVVLKQSPLVEKLRTAYWELVRRETT